MHPIARTLRQATLGAALAALFLFGGAARVAAQDATYPQATDDTQSVPGAPSAGAYGMMTLLFVVGGAIAVVAIVTIGRHERHRRSERAAGRAQ